jgi:hypothetical protein
LDLTGQSPKAIKVENGNAEGSPARPGRPPAEPGLSGDPADEPIPQKIELIIGFDRGRHRHVGLLVNREVIAQGMGVTSLGGATREVPVRAEPHLT